MKTINTDVLVIGSGAGGIATALKAALDGHSVLVIDKDRHLGGTSAISGGWAWVPGNKQGVQQGDTREEIETYIKALAGDTYDAAAVAGFLDTVPEAMQFFEDDAEIEFSYPEKAPDYQMDVPGAKVSGRAVTVPATDGRILGHNRLRVQPYLMSYTVFGYMPEIGPDIATFLKANQNLKAFRYAARKLSKTWIETILHKRAYTRTNGNALMTRLITAADAAGIRMWTSTRADELIRDASGVVTGARISGEHAGVVHARYGVVIAAGGFSGDTELRKKHFPHDPHGTNHTTPTIGHHGDSVALAEPFGGHIDARPHQPASWGPVTVFRGLRGQKRWFPHLRAFGLPGLIAVDRDGVRFANESLSYHDYGVEMIKNDEGREGTFGWIIADQKAMRRYGIGYAKPWPFPQTYFLRSGFLHKARTVAELAAKIGVPGGRLQATLDEFNAGAARGEDPKFGRGSNWFHHFKGDMEHKPNPNLETLDKGPFYAVKIEMGDLGTYAGLAVNDRSEVLDADDRPVPGLYAVGTAAVSVFGGGYPGYGANIGPAMVFGYRTGRDIAAIAAERETGASTCGAQSTLA
ncbi:FAD-dependent oxidoreductase [Saccharopolyspora sp. HNM0983]|uniref:FAD-dependent oxidoreductase n=1 Tax=Saccharopolyspora montiporae TaxID=2781240 RepID=A0A929FXY2_9PSEU|nr:FAD-dependent oxidoreductase [Saccharopolyspora sp. HNM0983]MBE9372864.1 FAD-dependent oxidoreductase [Saccharopolyspora sp. HNM0983]